MNCSTPPVLRLPQIAVICLSLTSAPLTFANEDFFTAARKGDVLTLKSHLDKGLDVNTKWRYDQTALMIAASRGHFEAVKLLLERGADVKGKDSFYGVTPLAAAMGFGSPVVEAISAAIARMLIEKGATGKEDLLKEAARSGKTEVVRTVLPLGPWKPETLTAALAATSGKHKQVEDMLKAAGATLPPEVKVAPAVLASYAGMYVMEDKRELKIEVVNGKLSGTFGSQVYRLRPLDQTTFEPEAEPGSQKVVFLTSGDVVSGVEVRAGTSVMKFSRKGAQ